MSEFNEFGKFDDSEDKKVFVWKGSSTFKEQDGWKKATVSEPPKKKGAILGVFAGLLIAGILLGFAVKNNIKIPESLTSSFQSAVTSVDSNGLNNLDENDIQGQTQDFSVFTEEETQGLIDAIEQGTQLQQEQAEQAGQTGQAGQNGQNTQNGQTEQTVQQPQEGASQSGQVEEVLPAETPIEELKEYEGQFELSIEGATGVVGNKRLSFTDLSSGESVKLDRGQTYTILNISEDEKFFTIMTQDGKMGQIETQDAWINLPDVIPSIIYKTSNNDASLYKSKGQDLPGVTGEKLYSEKAGYDCFQFNEKLGREEYLVPVDFDMAKKIQGAQEEALSQGYSLVIYETFRPMQVQQAVINGLNQIDTGGLTLEQYLNSGNGTNYNKSWFIAQGTSSHQYASAMDCSLAKVNSSTLGRSGEYKYTYHAEGDYEILEMPTAMHELSADSAVYKWGVTSMDEHAWESGVLKDSFAQNESAKLLQKICTANGLTPLSSEWWHFNDVASNKKQKARLQGEDTKDVGVITLGDCVSVDDVSKLLSQEKNLETNQNSNIDQANLDMEDGFDR